MNQFEKIRSSSKETLDALIAQGKEQPEAVQKWGVTGAAAVGGAVVISAAAKGVLGIVATLANPPVALTVGAVGGGLLGWNYIQKRLHDHDQESAENITVSPGETGASDTGTPDTGTPVTGTSGTGTSGTGTSGTGIPATPMPGTATTKPVTTKADAAKP